MAAFVEASAAPAWPVAQAERIAAMLAYAIPLVTAR